MTGQMLTNQSMQADIVTNLKRGSSDSLLLYDRMLVIHGASFLIYQ